MPRKYFRCDYFCLNKRDEKNHIFLAHQMGGRQPIEDKSLKKTFFHENLQRYCINFSKHEGYYDFYDSRKLADDFLTVFENVFILRSNLRRVCFKCSFTIINRQPAPKTGFVEITDSRVWQTNVHDGVYFHNFVKSNLAQDILKRMIMNGMTDSSWRFKRFDKICLTVNSDEFRNVDNYKINFDIFIMEFIDKYAKIDGSDHDDEVMFAGGDKVSYSNVEFVDDETNVQDQNPPDYRLMNVTRDLQEALQNQSMSANLGGFSDPENVVSDHVEEIEYEIDEYDVFKNRIKKLSKT